MTLGNMRELGERRQALGIAASCAWRIASHCSLRREDTMAEEKFSENLNRLIAAELHFFNRMTACREMFGKSYFSLGISEKAVVVSDSHRHHLWYSPRHNTGLTRTNGFRRPFTPDRVSA
jgi:hypothetical protein